MGLLHKLIPLLISRRSTNFPLVFTQIRSKVNHLDYSRYRKISIKEEDIEEDFVRGSGPGGQAVNKTSNCVVLRHIPTNTVIKCHKHRILDKNRKEARALLLEKLDNEINGDYSIEAQKKVLEGKKAAERLRKHRKLQEMKEEWEKRENITK